MAQLTAGVKFEWGVPGASDAEPTTWTLIPDVISVPELFGAPSQIDVTSIYDKAKVYIEGLQDNGGNLAFGVNFTPDVFTEVAKIIAQQETSDPYFRVVIPTPINKYYVWRGTCTPPSNSEISPDSALQGNIYVTPSTSIDTKTLSV